MREIVVPPVLAGPAAHLGQVPGINAGRAPAAVVFSRRAGSGWVEVTAAGFLAEVRRLAKGILAAGLGAGDRVGLMSRTRYEWTLFDFALWTAGCVSVPIYETSSPSQVEWILRDGGVRALVVETAAHARTATVGRDELPDLAHLWVIESGAVDELTAAGTEITDADLDARGAGLDRDTLATIVYTSGTTGRPRGCELTHGNFLALAENIGAALPEVVHVEGAATLLFLPLAHVLARLIEVTAVTAGVRIGHAPDVSDLLSDLQSFEPTFLLVVPRVLEKIYNSTDQRLAMQGRSALFRLAVRTAIAYSRALDQGGPGLGLRVQHALFDAIVYRKLRAAMGGQVRWAVCGGAPLGARLGHFYRGIGIHVLEGYGLTETTAPLTVGTPTLTRVGTVGMPLPGCGVRIADDDEILAQGVGVFRGYRGDEAATTAMYTPDGWLRTGDIGHLDQDGCLTITGRKKEILVTAGGKNVSPARLEDLIRAHPLVSQCIVVGDRRPYIAALMTLDADMVPVWGAAHQRPDLTPQTALSDPFVRERLQMAVDRANATVSRAESVRVFDLLPGDFTEADGLLTPSLKMRREAVLKVHVHDVERLYAGEDPVGPDR